MILNLLSWLFYIKSDASILLCLLDVGLTQFETVCYSSAPSNVVELSNSWALLELSSLLISLPNTKYQNKNNKPCICGDRKISISPIVCVPFVAALGNQYTLSMTEFHTLLCNLLLYKMREYNIIVFSEYCITIFKKKLSVCMLTYL